MIWKKYREAIVVLMFFAAMAGIYFFAIRGLLAEIENKKNRFQELTAIQENQRKRLGDLPELRKDFETANMEEVKIHPFLKREKAVELIQEIEDLSEKTGNQVAIEVVNPEAPSRGSAKNVTETIVSALPMKDYIQLKISVTGSFFSFLKFLNKLENSNYYLDVTSLQISGNPNPKDKSAAALASKNPFGQYAAGNTKEIPENKIAEIIGVINMAVYTQN